LSFETVLIVIIHGGSLGAFFVVNEIYISHTFVIIHGF